MEIRYLNYDIATNDIRTQNTIKIQFVVVRLECAFSTSQTLTLDAIIFCITIVCNIYTYTYNKSFMELLSRFPKLIMWYKITLYRIICNKNYLVNFQWGLKLTFVVIKRVKHFNVKHWSQQSDKTIFWCVYITNMTLGKYGLRQWHFLWKPHILAFC